MFAALTLFGLPQPTLAETGGEGVDAIDDQNVIVITGTRSERELAAEPYAIAVITQQDLERELPRTVPEALRNIPGVLVQKTASGHGSPFIRGFTGNRTLLVIDGIRYNNATYRDGANEYFAQIDSFTLDRIELISGPSSALYGSEAVGGVLSLSTRSSGISEQTGQFAEGEQIIRLSGGDGSVVSRSVVEIGRGGVWGLRAGVSLRDYNTIEAAELGTLPYTGYSERSANARLDVALAPRWTATLNHHSLWQDGVPRTHSTAFAVPFAGTSVGSDLLREKDHERGLTYLKIKGATDTPALRTLEVTLSYQSRFEAERRVRADQLRIDQSFGSDLLALIAVGSGGSGDLELTYGVDLSRETIDSARRDSDPSTGVIITRLQGPVGTDARYDQLGVFLRASVDLTEQFAIEGSLRSSLVSAKVGQFADPVTGQARQFADEWSDLSGSIRAMYRTSGHTLWSAYSRSFRAPNIADISRLGRSRSNEIEVASLGVTPETFDTLELGYRFQTAAIELGVSAYTTRLNDFIATVPTGRIRGGLIEVAKQNAVSGRVSGAELSLRATLGGGFSLQGNATWLRGDQIIHGVAGLVKEPISRIQPLTSNVALSWEQAENWVIAELSLVDRANRLSSGDLLDQQRIPPGGTPGYALLNLRGGFELADSLSVTLALNNLFNQAFRSHGSGNNEPGRHATAGLHFRF